MTPGATGLWEPGQFCSIVGAQTVAEGRWEAR